MHDSTIVSTEKSKTQHASQPWSALTHIRKRDGQEVRFDAAKITAAIEAAGRATGEFGDEMAMRLTVRVLTVAHQVFVSTMPSVEALQDIVEEVLLASPHRATAKAYILYREQHARVRELKALADVHLVDEYLERLDWTVNENSNMGYSLQGLNNYVSSAVSKSYWLNKIYPPEVRRAHHDGDFHIHDLNLLSVYCVGWDLQDLLASGFCGAPGRVESSPPRHLRTALGQIANFFYTLQGEAAGAQAFSNFDTLLAPFVRHDALAYADVKQALQEFVFNLNVPTRVGFQTPFTNLTLDFKVPAAFRDEPVIIGGKRQEATYGTHQAEMDLINRALFEVLSEGDAKGSVFTFPIPTVNIGSDFDWQDRTLDPLWTATARYGIPYFANYVNSELAPQDARSMCCRLRLDLRRLDHRGGSLFGANPLTGSIGVVTINMPRLGYRATSKAEFIDQLDGLINLARLSLDIKRKALESFTDKQLYPYTSYYLRRVKERFGKYWHNHFATIGLVGMNEACLNLLGIDIGHRDGRAFALEVLDHMRSRLRGFQEDSGLLYNLEATPAESAGYRLARLDCHRFPSIVHGNKPGGRPFYNNSTQLPPDYSDDVFAVLDQQDDLQRRYTGGTVLHVYMGEAQMDVASVKSFVRRVCESYHLPYFTITPTFSVCPHCGYLPGEFSSCAHCGTSCEVYSRVVGYLRPVSQWNEGKKEEYARRTPFDLGL